MNWLTFANALCIEGAVEGGSDDMGKSAFPPETCIEGAVIGTWDIFDGPALPGRF